MYIPKAQECFPEKLSGHSGAAAPDGVPWITKLTESGAVRSPVALRCCFYITETNDVPIPISSSQGTHYSKFLFKWSQRKRHGYGVIIDNAAANVYPWGNGMFL